jgi:serine/threonine protein kinase
VVGHDGFNGPSAGHAVAGPTTKLISLAGMSPRRADVPDTVYHGERHGSWQPRRVEVRGRSGVTYRAWNDSLCVCGNLRALGRATEDARERFRRERYTLLELSHPCVVGLIDYGDDPEPFLITQIPALGTVSGLVDVIRADLWRALRMARDVASGLAEAHGGGFVHRDVQPDNIFLMSLDHAAIGGFGIVHDPDLETITRIGDQMGSRPFAPPESFEGNPSPSFDVFSLGATIHAVLLGTVSPSPPYTLRTSYRPLANALQDPRLAALDTLLERMVRLDASQRPQHASEVVTELDSVIAKLFDAH